MNDAKHNETEKMSLSKARKIERKKEIIKMKRDAQFSRILSACVIVVIVAGLVSLIGYSIYRGITRVKPSSDYSAALTEEGLIKNVQATSHLELPDYSNITVPLKEVEYTDEALEEAIKTMLENKSELDKDTEALIKFGDKVNIDYVGTVDGVEFAGGNTQGAGTDLEIGSGDYIDDFEEQLIGHGVGDKVTVEVTFPDDYSETDLAGKDAVFEVVINGIYVVPEFTDEFVEENLSEYASTTDEYRTYLKEFNYNNNLSKWLEKYLMDNTTVTSYPESYMKHLKSIRKYEDQSSFEYLNQLYSAMGNQAYASFEQYIGKSEAKYDKELASLVQDDAKKALIFQAIYEAEGLKVTTDDFDKYMSEESIEDYDSYVDVYGKGYTMQQLIGGKVLEYLRETVKVQ